MISRRNLRINVMQSIFESNAQENKSNKEFGIKTFNEKIKQTQALYTASVHLAYLISQYVITYADQKASKYRPTIEDKNINIKLANNILIEQLKHNLSFINSIKTNHLAHFFEEDTIKKLFLKLIHTEEYKEYISTNDRTVQSEKKIIETILNLCIFENEDTSVLLSDKFMSWFNDFEMLDSWNQSLLLNMKKFNFEEIISQEKRNFATDLIACYFDKKETVFNLISPKLINWDADRIPSLDMIILHLGICEFLYFETIPTKVTINEYIDIAKSYSTDQSGQFVNGLLDNVRKDLEQQNFIHKVDFIKK